MLVFVVGFIFILSDLGKTIMTKIIISNNCQSTNKLKEKMLVSFCMMFLKVKSRILQVIMAIFLKIIVSIVCSIVIII